MSKRKIAMFIALVLLLGMAATVLAASVYSWHLTSTSNVPCSELDDGYADSGTTWAELKLEEDQGQVADGTYTFGTLSVTLSNVVYNDDGEPIGFNWESNFGVDAVVVKDGMDGQNFYVYDGLTSPADGTVGPSGGTTRDIEQQSDTGLTTPGPEAGGTYKGISHISFCYDAEEPETGSLEVTKVVDWNGVDPDPGQTFEVCVSGVSVSYGPECKEFDADGGTLTWDDLEPGEYAVSETDPGDEWTVEVNASPVSVEEGATAEVIVTNTHEPPPELGSIEVTKVVNWNCFDPDPGQTFEVCVSGVSVSYGPECKEFGADGGTLTWDGLEPGEYAVSETNPGAEWTVTIESSPVTVEGGSTAQVTVTNTYEKTTAIDLVSFTAQAGADGVTLAWETATELDNAGFNLYRALLQDGPYTQVNGALIAAQGDAMSGASYSFLDAPGYGTFYYKLEDVDYHGVSTMHGPVKVTVARPLRRPLYRPTLPQF